MPVDGEALRVVEGVLLQLVELDRDPGPPPVSLAEVGRDGLRGVEPEGGSRGRLGLPRADGAPRGPARATASGPGAGSPRSSGTLASSPRRRTPGRGAAGNRRVASTQGPRGQSFGADACDKASPRPPTCDRGPLRAPARTCANLARGPKARNGRRGAVRARRGGLFRLTLGDPRRPDRAGAGPDGRRRPGGER